MSHSRRPFSKLFLLPACLSPFYGSKSCFSLVIELRSNYQALLQNNPLTFINFPIFIYIFFRFSFSKQFSGTFSSPDFLFFGPYSYLCSFPRFIWEIHLFIPNNFHRENYSMLSDCQLLNIYMNSQIPFLPPNLLYRFKRALLFLPAMSFPRHVISSLFLFSASRFSP